MKPVNDKLKMRKLAEFKKKMELNLMNGLQYSAHGKWIMRDQENYYKQLNPDDFEKQYQPAASLLNLLHSIR